MARTNYIEALIEDGGEITIGALPPHECVATAADGSNCLAWSNDTFVDEVNDGQSKLL